MARGPIWSEKDIALAIKMYENGNDYPAMCESLNRPKSSVKSIIEQHSSKETRRLRLESKQIAKEIKHKAFKSINDQKEIQKMDCYNRGLTDKKAAAECGISESAYWKWRIRRGLTKNEHVLPDAESKLVPEVIKYIAKKRVDLKVRTKTNRIVLTADDIKNYKHNPPAIVDYSDKVVMKVDIGPSNVELAPITGQLNKGMKPPSLGGKLIGRPTHENVLIPKIARVKHEDKRRLSFYG